MDGSVEGQCNSLQAINISYIMFMIHQYYNNDFEQFNEVYTDAQVTVNVYNSV